MSEMPFAVAPVMGLLAATPAAGYTLVNGTGAIISWTAPADGQLHRAILYFVQRVTSTETGGQCQFAIVDPSGSTFTQTPVAGGTAGPSHQQGSNTGMIQAGSTVTFSQSTALTLGAAVLWAELWGS
jgi:hypothetical protein